MQKYLAVATFIILIILIVFRNFQMKNAGIKVIHFGEMDKKDFLIMPFAVLLFYLVIASAFNLPGLGAELFENCIIRWIGVALCLLGLILFTLSLFAIGKSFRLGIDVKNPGSLITKGIYAISRNPMYISLGSILLGLFLIIPNWIILIELFGGLWLINRQVLLEENSLKKIYGEEYLVYCRKVRRYLF